MNRRDFFKTIGIPALVLPIVKLPKKGYANQQLHSFIRQPKSYPWSSLIVTCPHCKQIKLHIPYMSKPNCKINDHKCIGCGNYYSIIIRSNRDKVSAEIYTDYRMQSIQQSKKISTSWEENHR